MATSFSPTLLAAVCRRCGPSVGPLPPNVDGAQLLWALSGVESSFGKDCTPRHEPAYDVGGTYAKHYPVNVLLSRYGAAAACSYGPLQLMLCNAPLTFSPSSFDDLSLAMQASVAFLNGLLRHWKPQSLDEIGECWNAGHETPDPEYTERLTRSYSVQMPSSSLISGN
jgi:hypothetical protein